MPVVINIQPGIEKSSWPVVEEPSSRSMEESIPFTRPAITTGAHLPWNVRKKSAYGMPRAICPLQTVPPITLLNNRKEATKLVYSKDSENAAQRGAVETPFKQSSCITLPQEDSTQKFVEGQALSSAPAVPLASLQPLDHDRVSSIQASSGVVSLKMPNGSETIRPVSQNSNTPYQGHPSNQAFYSAKQEQLLEPQAGPMVKSEYIPTEWMHPMVANPKEEVNFICDPSVPTEKVGVVRLRNSYGAESAGPINTQSSSLYRSSEDSSLIRQSEAGLPLESSETVDNSSRSQSLADKRKADAIEPLSVLEANDLNTLHGEDLKENSVSEQRAVRRRLTNRASALRTAEKKNQELSRMERAIEKLQNEHSELQAKWKRQVKTCSDLRHSLESTRQKLKTQEDDNSKLKSEMEFLRSNLAMLPPQQRSFGASANDGESPNSAGPGNWTPDYPFPTGMPTQAEIAADLELDRQLLNQDSGLDYLKEWQMW